MVRAIETMSDFAKIIHKLLKSDRDVTVGVSGMTGEGKSTFLTLLQKKYAEISGTKWDFSHMTWSRAELMKWIDGDENGEGKMPEYSAILVDELFTMFYRRTWYESDQIDTIATFNMCRDRHLFIGGNVPDFWDLDNAFVSRLRFFVYIPYRGVAWVFEQENNPFCKDKWNRSENQKLIRRGKGRPYKCKNFICELHYPDWNPVEKKEYYSIRNVKRVDAIKENKPEKKEKYKDIKDQRNAAIALCFKLNSKLTNKAAAEMLGLSMECVRLARNENQ